MPVPSLLPALTGISDRHSVTARESHHYEKALIFRGNSELNTKVRLREHIKAGNDSGTKRGGRCAAHTLPRTRCPFPSLSQSQPRGTSRDCEPGAAVPGPPGSTSTASRSRAGSRPSAPPLTAQHEEQHAGQRGHDHQQGQPDALPHGAAGGSRRDPDRAGGRGGPAPAPPPAADRPGGPAGLGCRSVAWREGCAGWLGVVVHSPPQRPERKGNPRREDYKSRCALQHGGDAGGR